MKTMKKIFSLLLLGAMGMTATAQNVNYNIISEKDTTISVIVEDIKLGSRDIHRILYEFPSTDAESKPVNISGAVWIPSNVYDGSAPCDGVVLYNHFTHTKAAERASVVGEELCNGLLSSPLKPNYILVISDYLGFGITEDRPQAYLCGDINARSSLDGLVAARQLMEDMQIPQGKYLFNMGYSQGGTETMFVAKLRDMEYKDRGITFDKTFSGGGPLDFDKSYTEVVSNGQTAAPGGLVLLLVSLNENYHLGLDYKQVFKEPLASHIDDWILSKDYNLTEVRELIGSDSLKHYLQPDYLDINSEAAKVLRQKLKDITLTNGWEPDATQNYFIEHSRHDEYVPIQSVRNIFSWMKGKGFKKSIVPGKTNLQTNTAVFKLGHIASGIVWFIQTAAAIQVWPVLYYEGEQNRYYHDVVKDMNLMKAVKMLESLGVDLRQIKGGGGGGGSFWDFITELAKTLAKVDLTIADLYEMLDDSGISITDVMEVYAYLSSTKAESVLQSAENNIEAPIYLMRQYEQALATWFLTAGIDVNYKTWGW